MGSQNKSIDSLTGLRGVAACLVLLAHASMVATAGTYLQGVTGVVALQLAYLAMTCFFVLSGFVISINYSRFIFVNGLGGLSVFFVKRFARLYPLYYFTLLLTVSNAPHFQPVTQHAFNLLSYLLLLQSWFNQQGLLFEPAWSISTEIFFYIIFSGLVISFSSLPKHYLAPFRQYFLPLIIIGFITLVGSSYGIYRLSILFAHSIKTYPVPNGGVDWAYWLRYYSPLVRILEFFAGCLTGYLCLYLGKKITAFLRSTAFVTAAALILLIFLVCAFGELPNNYLSWANANFLYSFPVCLLIFSLAYPQCRITCSTVSKSNTLYQVTQLLSGKKALMIGETSYSIYMLQHWTWSMMGPKPSERFSLALFAVIWILLFSLFSIFIAMGSYSYLERPAKSHILRTYKHFVSSISACP